MRGRKFIKIQDHHGGPVEVIGFHASTPAYLVVERWQRNHWRTSLSGRPEPCTWSVLGAGGIVEALIESAKS